MDGKQFTAAFGQIGPEGRIQEHDVHGLVFAIGFFGEPLHGVSPFDSAGNAPFAHNLAQPCGGCALRLHKDALRRAAGKRLQAKSPGAGEQVQATRSGHQRGEPVEQGFACARRRGTHARRHLQHAAAEASTRDAHAPSLLNPHISRPEFRKLVRYAGQLPTWRESIISCAAMIRLQQVTMRYRGGAEALSEVSVSVEPGEFTYLTGPSGAGKTTLIKLLAAIERPTRGQVFVLGRNVSRLKRRAICRHRRNIGVVFQNNLLLEDRNAYENVALPLHISGLGPREVRRRTEAALDSVGLLANARRLPRLLSQGEQQRLGIARAVVSRPELLIADEPTGNLDPELSREVMALFRRMAGYGVTALVATHDLALIESSPARRISLLDGRVESDTLPA